jgi:carbamoyltransferase
MQEHSNVTTTDSGLIAGLGGCVEGGCAALCDNGTVLGICGQERVTRVRAAGFNSNGLPDEALDLLLTRAGRNRSDIARYSCAEDGVAKGLQNTVRLDHHHGHACSSYLSSPFDSAVIVICDHSSPKVSVWKGAGSKVTPVEWPWAGDGFSDLYSLFARLLEFKSGANQQFEALARLDADHRDDRLDAIFRTDGNSISAKDGWEVRLADLWQGHGSLTATALHAAALQRRLGELLLEFLRKVRAETDLEHCCLGGSLFYHSSINTLVRASGLFTRVFVPVNPGNAGLSVGTALQLIGHKPVQLSPFLGPAYSEGEIKATLENCKLPYRWVSESESVEMAVDALKRGRLVAWYEGAMEWGPRALGGRSILANPFSPYVLENLNRFLKNREPWRGYAVSVLQSAAAQHFSGPAEAPFMECDFRPLDLERFRHILPTERAAIRVQFAGPQTPLRFRKVLQSFGQVTGVPCLVNTSFNGFQEPIVCSPRDAIRVFYGSGIDDLFMGSFVLTK